MGDWISNGQFFFRRYLSVLCFSTGFSLSLARSQWMCWGGGGLSHLFGLGCATRVAQLRRKVVPSLATTGSCTSLFITREPITKRRRERGGDCTLFQSCIKRKVIRHIAKSRPQRLNSAQTVRGTKYTAQPRVCPGCLPSVRPSHTGLCMLCTPNTLVFRVRSPKAVRITAHILAIVSSRCTGVLCLPLSRECSTPERRQNH